MTWYKAALLADTQSAWIEARARLAGTQSLSASVVQSEALLEGSRASKSLLNKSVYSDKTERVGTAGEWTIAHDGAISAAIASAGEVLKVAVHDIALPIRGVDFCDRRSVSDAEIFERAHRPARCRCTDLRTIVLEQRLDGCKRVRSGHVTRGNGPCS
jgi:hypothetical protein